MRRGFHCASGSILHLFHARPRVARQNSRHLRILERAQRARFVRRAQTCAGGGPPPRKAWLHSRGARPAQTAISTATASVSHNPPGDPADPEGSFCTLAMQCNARLGTARARARFANASLVCKVHVNRLRASWGPGPPRESETRRSAPALLQASMSSRTLVQLHSISPQRPKMAFGGSGFHHELGRPGSQAAASLRMPGLRFLPSMRPSAAKSSLVLLLAA